MTQPTKRTISLKLSLSLVVLFLLVCSAIVSVFTVRDTSEQVVEDWARQYSTKLADHDQIRILQPLMRDKNAIEKLVQEPIIVNWLSNPQSDALAHQALLRLERSRIHLLEQNYFAVSLATGQYFHNNQQNQFLGKEYRYTLSPERARDRWFYDLIEQNRDLHININPDEELGITKLWIDMLVRDHSGNAVGMLGTGIDLTNFTAIDDDQQLGSTSFYVNHNGAIQLHDDHAFIDFASISKRLQDHKSIELLFDDSEDLQAIYQSMQQLERNSEQNDSLFVEVSGQRSLLTIVYLPNFKWFQFTLIDLESLLPAATFVPVIATHVLLLVLVMALLLLTLHRWLLAPIEQINQAMRHIESGQNPAIVTNHGIGEIASLASHFNTMSRKVISYQRDLEQKVQQRTEALEKISKTDALTGLLNRHGMTQHISNLLADNDPNKSIGLLSIDVDNFKAINDQFGHPGGDSALVDIAGLINDCTDQLGIASRWGGDEYLVVFEQIDEDQLKQCGLCICNAVKALRNPKFNYQASVSIGSCLGQGNEQLNDLLKQVDDALYQAKRQGKNCYVATDEQVLA